MATGDDPSPRASEGLAVRLLLHPGEPLSGTVAVEDEEGTTEFSGWIELMAAINAAREASSGEDRGGH